MEEKEIMTYEQIYKVIKLYNQYKGCLNDNGTVASNEQIAEWIIPSVEDAINEAKKHGFWMRDKAEKYLRMITFIDNNESGELRYIDGYCVSDLLENFVWHDDGSQCGIKTK